MPMTNRNTTDILKSDLDDDDNVRWLYERFIEETKHAIEARMPDALMGRIEVESLASTTLRQAIESIKQNAIHRGSSSLFRALCLKIAKNELLNVVESLKTQMRDVSRETQSDHGTPKAPIGRRHSELKKAEINDLLKKTIIELLQEKKQVDTLINLLGVALELKANAIQEILMQHPDNLSVPSLPTIRSQIEAARERVMKFRRELEDDDLDD